MIGDTNGNLIQGLDGDDTLSGHGGDDIVQGDEGDDRLHGDLASDTSIVGNDTLFGGLGDDTLEGGRGVDSINGGEGFDVVSFSSTDSAVQVNLDNASSTADGLVETFTSIEGVEGSAHDDVFAGSGGPFSFEGLGGNDTINAGAGESRYYYNLGDGNDFITDFDAGGQSANDTFTFRDVAVDDVQFRHGSSNDLIMTLADGGFVTANNHFDSDSDYQIESIVFTDVTLNLQETRDKTVFDMKPSGTVIGSALRENYFHTLGDGTYVITDFDPGGQTADDTFTFTNVGVNDVQFRHQITNELVMTLSNGETITVTNHFDEDSDYQIEFIKFADVTLSLQQTRDKTVSDMKTSGTVTGSDLAEKF